MMLTLLSSAAQEESMSISNNLRWSYQKRMKNGEFITCYSPYGYTLENRTLVINEEQAQIVREIFKRFINGESKHSIAKWLTDAKIPKKSGKTNWNHNVIKFILANERYIGDALLQKWHTTTTLPFKQKPNKGEVDMYYIENSHPPIISQEEFEKAQKLNTEKKNRHYSNNAPQEYPLSRKIECGKCGSTFRRKVTRNIIYWNCYTHNRSKNDCDTKQIPESEIYSAFIRMYNKLKLNSKKILHSIFTDLQALKRHTTVNNMKIMEIW